MASNAESEKKRAALEAIIRPIVEGQIRGFLKEHPKLVEAVDWYKPRKDKATTFTNSLSKRIVRDLTCGTSAARLERALLEFGLGREPVVADGSSNCAQQRKGWHLNWLFRPRAILNEKQEGGEK